MDRSEFLLSFEFLLICFFNLRFCWPWLSARGTSSPKARGPF